MESSKKDMKILLKSQQGELDAVLYKSPINAKMPRKATMHRFFIS